ncbi:MAG: hypothetical protein J6R22_03735 [Alphaproteobacteria bacterium]|nr:hypothetical protein [Alphaproteobacteria bacterium]
MSETCVIMLNAVSITTLAREYGRVWHPLATKMPVITTIIQQLLLTKNAHSKSNDCSNYTHPDFTHLGQWFNKQKILG